MSKTEWNNVSVSPPNYLTVIVKLEDGTEMETWMFPDKSWGYELKPTHWKKK